ncbi:MAG: hypothetical protein U0790_01555 [Isosphaeraceae bacterium]
MAGHRLTTAVEEELVDDRAHRELRPDDAVAEGLPSQFKPRPAAEDDVLARGGGVGHGMLPRAGVPWREDERVGQFVDPGMEQHRDGRPAGLPTRRPLRGDEGPQRVVRRGGGRVPAAG